MRPPQELVGPFLQYKLHNIIYNAIKAPHRYAVQVRSFILFTKKDK